jgi:hypothetical protein
MPEKAVMLDGTHKLTNLGLKYTPLETDEAGKSVTP